VIAELEAQLGQSDANLEKLKILKELETQLAILKTQKGYSHPDILKLNKEIEILTKEVENIPGGKAEKQLIEEQPDNPMYINLKTQLFINEAELKALKEEKEAVQKTIEETQLRVDRSPMIEKEYNELTLDYDNTKRKYNEIMGKLMEAKITQGMEMSQRGERFILLEPADFPEKPYKPNRIAIIAIGLFLSIGFGSFAVIVLEVFDNSIKTTDDLNFLGDISVFSVIPLIENKDDIRRRRRKKLLWIITIAILVVIALTIIHLYGIPLDKIWEK
jgi:uncharacterized protein involved in exopolysaccharide biosynthesis